MNKKERMALINSAIRDTFEANIVALVVYVIFLIIGISANVSVEKAKDIALYSIIVFGISLFFRISVPSLKQEQGIERVKRMTILLFTIPIMLCSFTLCISHYLFL